MKKSMKIVSILMMAIMMVMVATPVFATTTITPEQPSGATTSGILSLAGKILGFLQWIAGIAAVLIVAIFGIKYMMGSLEEKAEYKKTFIPLIVGIVVVFGAVTIGNLLINTFKI